MPTRNPTDRRRQQLAHMDSHKLDAICEPAIATVQAILALPSPGPSPTLRGTAGKYLNDALASVAGYRRAPIRKMKNLLSKLCTPGKAYPYADLPPKGPGEELIELAKDVVKAMPLLRGDEAATSARRLLKLIDEFYPITPTELTKIKRALAKFVPDYIEPPDLRAQFIPHLTLPLMKMPPAGHA